MPKNVKNSDDIVEFTGEHAFLSNFYTSTFVLDTVRYKSVVQAYYGLRTKDHTAALTILEMTNSHEIVKFGKKLPSFNDWNKRSRDVMKRAIRAKFNNPFLAPQLLKTGGRRLGDGRNFTGEILMEIREELRSEEG